MSEDLEPRYVAEFSVAIEASAGLRHPVRRFALGSLAGVLLFVSASCNALPNVKPFAAASLELERTALKSFEAAGDAQALMASLLNVPAGHPQHSALTPKSTNYTRLADSIRTDGAERAKLLRALTDYTDSLAAIVQAAEDAELNVERLEGSLTELASTFGASTLSPVASGVAKLVSLAATEAIKMKAAGSLRAALALADPVIQEAAKLLRADAADLRKSVAYKKASVTAAVNLVYEYQKQLDYLQVLEDRRTALLKAIAASGAAAVEATSDSASLVKLEAQLAAAKASAAPVVARRANAIEAVQAAEKLVVKLEEAIVAWAKAHADLTLAAKEGHGVNVRRLTQIVLEAKEIVEDMKKAKEKRNDI